MEEEQLYKLGQKVYLVLNGVYNDVAGDERTTFIEETIDWANQFLEELAMEADWSWLRQNDVELGTVATADGTIDLPETTLRLVTDWQRPVVMTKPDGKKIYWQVVSPNVLNNPTHNEPYTNRLAIVGRKIKFSRPLTAEELNSTFRGDIIGGFPEITTTNTEALDLVRPKQLVVLGMAKNGVLPDVVNNTLTANYDVKYQRMLRRAIALDGATTDNGEVEREDLSFIGGVY